MADNWLKSQRENPNWKFPKKQLLTAAAKLWC